MDRPPEFFGENIQDDEDDKYDLFSSQRMQDRDYAYQDTSPSVDPDDPSIDALPLKSRSPDPFPMDSTRTHTPRRLPSSRARNKTSQSNLAETESSGVTNTSSKTSGTRSSKKTLTPEKASSSSGENSSITNGFPPPKSSPANKKRQRKQHINEYLTQGLETVKRHRFLERNRVAATKCRQKKKEWVSDLEEARFGLESQNNHLQMEYTSLRDEITHIKSQLMEHASCNDPNIDKWIENEAKKFVLGTSERYDRMLADLGTTPGLAGHRGSISSPTGYPDIPEPELISPVTSSHRGSVSFPPGNFMPNSPVFYRPDLTPNIPQVTPSIPVEEPYPGNQIPNSIPENVSGFNSVPMANDVFQDPTVPEG
ncbi:uncharacterized protein F4822DRAFT_426848 [Hypoxylon trugodes]|uniref:uncharacterized protein n=1 Tax=Hypoxylon trugodes TaxID=326681 RepID=UPI002193A003|nr:uncharacterized protein F4822DRAFT_426848 [Hypoxylon trugodes]KAI1390995.1 hypothetical protein F4822DRAFT_426848 [Hypoxylon trugodes]